VGCRYRNVKGYSVSRRVDGEVKGEAVEATFSKGGFRKCNADFVGLQQN